MQTQAKTRATVPSLEIRQGLPVEEVHAHLHRCRRLADAGQYGLSFYLAEMDERQLHNATGHSTTAHFAETQLGLDRRRTAELIRMGKKLLDLPEIDRAFREGRIGMAKVRLLMQVATPEHEPAWLERAETQTCKQLQRDVKLSKPGAAPRKPGDVKGLPEVRFSIRADVDVVTHQKWELARQKLSAERGATYTDAELVSALTDLVLSTNDDGSVPGRTPVDASIYRVVLREEAGDDGQSCLAVDTEDGPMPVKNCDCYACDTDGVDRKTPPALRRRVIARDGGRCRCCGSRHGLMVHHIVYRSKGGKTRAFNLITLCTSCHALVHTDLLVLEGDDAGDVRFVDNEGRPVHDPHRHAPPDSVVAIDQPEAPHVRRAHAPHVRRVTLDEVPATIDAGWWRAHAHLIRCRGDRGLEFKAGTPRPTPEPAPAPAARSLDEAFGHVVGQDALLERLEIAASGCRSRGRTFPHTLFVGPPGTGKTTLARGIASRSGSRLLDTSGPLLKDPHALIRLLAQLGEADMLFIDEIHAVPRSVLEMLYQAMAERRISLTLHDAGTERATGLELPAFSLLGATTEEAQLPDPLRSRFGIQESLDFYRREDLAALVTYAARGQTFLLDAEGATRVADCSRGTPREALRLLDRILDEAASAGRSRVDREIVESALARLGYDRTGLNPVEQRYLALLRRSPLPIPLGRLARMLGVSEETVAKYLEPYLFRRGLVRMTSRGRAA